MVFGGGASQESAVDSGMKSLDASAQDLRGPGVVCYFCDRDIVVPQQFRGSAGSKQPPAEIRETFGKFDESAFVVHGEEGGGHARRVTNRR